MKCCIYLIFVKPHPPPSPLLNVIPGWASAVCPAVVVGHHRCAVRWESVKLVTRLFSVFNVVGFFFQVLDSAGF